MPFELAVAISADRIVKPGNPENNKLVTFLFGCDMCITKCYLETVLASRL